MGWGKTIGKVVISVNKGLNLDDGSGNGKEKDMDRKLRVSF